MFKKLSTYYNHEFQVVYLIVQNKYDLPDSNPLTRFTNLSNESYKVVIVRNFVETPPDTRKLNPLVFFSVLLNEAGHQWSAVERKRTVLRQRTFFATDNYFLRLLIAPLFKQRHSYVHRHLNLVLILANCMPDRTKMAPWELFRLGERDD